MRLCAFVCVSFLSFVFQATFGLIKFIHDHFLRMTTTTVQLLIQIALQAPSSQNTFDVLMNLIRDHRDTPAHTIQDLKDKNNKLVGDLFERWCVLYLTLKGYEAYLLSELPRERKDALKLKTRDVGIDIVAYKDSKVIAVQCKYRSPTVDQYRRTVHRVPWKDVSTFIALCSTTGPYDKHLVMTNADYVTRYGHKSDKDSTWAKKTFQSTSREDWMTMRKNTTNPTSSSTDPVNNGATLDNPVARNATTVDAHPDIPTSSQSSSTIARAARLAWLDKISTQK